MALSAGLGPELDNRSADGNACAVNRDVSVRAYSDVAYRVDSRTGCERSKVDYGVLGNCASCLRLWLRNREKHEDCDESRPGRPSFQSHSCSPVGDHNSALTTTL